MLQTFRDNFQRCLEQFRQEIAGDTSLLALLNPFYGLYDPAVYEQWKLTSDMRYFEAANLIYIMDTFHSMPSELTLLAEEFLAAGYDALPGPDFDPALIKEQLKLIYMIVRGDTNMPEVTLAE